MNAQEIFDKAVGGVIRQGDLATDSNGGCCYRTDDGRACGVGQLIDDMTADLWDEISNSSIRQIAAVVGLPKHLDEHIELLADIQEIHDNAAERLTDEDARLLEFLAQARIVASRHGLEMNFSDQDILEALS